MYALIIAGGEGERLRPLTDDRPKPMIEVAGRPILEYQIRWLAREGVSDAVLLCGYKAEVIQNHFGDGSRFGLRVQYSLEDEPLGRGGALKLACRHVPPSEEFVIGTNGDNLNTQPLASMVRQHQRTEAVATLLLTQLRSPYGIAKQQGKRIVGFREKPLLSHWLSAGVYVLSREFFEMLPKVGDHENEVFPRLAAAGRLYGFRSRTYWKGIDTVKDLSEAEREVRELALV